MPKVLTKFLKEALESISKVSTKNINFTNKGNNTNPLIRQSISVASDSNQLFAPNEILGEFTAGRRMAGSFFEHPVVQESYNHNRELAKRLGIELQDRPSNIREVVTRPMKLKWATDDGFTLAQTREHHFNDPDANFTITWKPFTKPSLKAAGRHESLHLGYYSAPFRMENITKEIYDNVYKPNYQFWKWKTDKLLRPEFRETSYLSDVWGGEAGPNLIDLGQDLGLKLGQKYPGDNAFLKMINDYKGEKSFLVPHLQLDTPAGRRHVWDAMVGKYFAIPAVGVGLTSLQNND